MRIEFPPGNKKQQEEIGVDFETTAFKLYLHLGSAPLPEQSCVSPHARRNLHPLVKRSLQQQNSYMSLQIPDLRDMWVMIGLPQPFLQKEGFTSLGIVKNFAMISTVFSNLFHCLPLKSFPGPVPLKGVKRNAFFSRASFLSLNSRAWQVISQPKIFFNQC